MDQFTKLLEFLKTYGAPVVLLWAIVETDLVFLVIGALAHAGYVNLLSCFPAAIIGAMLHDTAVFWLARHRAEWVRARGVYQEFSPSIERFASKTGAWQLSICRPLYGTRYPTIIFWGLQHISYPRFYTAISAGLLPWAAILASIGYALSNRIEDFDDWLLEAKHWILGAIFVAIVIYFIKKRLFKKSAAPVVPPTQDGARGANSSAENLY